ncbi:MAG: hypothetical protein GX946_09630 [Oligosphaeraceae bacterium]|nr:hypothetical protein [Oligosphaeraceae bacterium]
MKKITLVCLSSQRQSALSALQSLGLFHIAVAAEQASVESQKLRQQEQDTGQALFILSSYAKEAEKKAGAAQPGEDLVARVLNLSQERKRNLERQNELRPAIEKLEPWGEFSVQTLEQFAERGWHAALCNASTEQMPELPEHCCVQTVKQAAGRNYFVVFSPNPLQDLELPLEKFPHGMDLAALRQELAQLQAEEQQIEAELLQLAGSQMDALQREKALLEERIAYAAAEDAMAEAGEQLSYLSGYVPEERLPELLQAARKEGWGLRYLEADPEDPDVPTKLRIPRRLQMAQQIFDFIGVLPGYNEIDISVAFLVFLSIFCGMLVGDAGYGALLLATGIGLFLASKPDEVKKRESIMLLIIMSSCILVFGMLTGNWFGLPPEKLPLVMRGIPWFRDDTNSTNVKLIGFIIGVFHLSLARFWAAAVSGNLRESLGHVGWMLFLWGNFFTVKMLLISGGSLGLLPKILYGIGTALILTCSVNWADMGDVIYTPFNFVNSLVDVLSYLRLYAVGLSSFFIADSFNAMSAMVWKVSPWLIPMSLFIILSGHCLNIALAAMGVLVHGIRLNTLEFSGHIGLSWSGKPYLPLKTAEIED